MLQIKKHHSFSLPSLTTATHRLAMSPVVSEDDELIHDIDTADSDDVWTLDPTPDTQELSRYWTTVERDLQNDPDWVNFAEE